METRKIQNGDLTNSEWRLDLQQQQHQDDVKQKHRDEYPIPSHYFRDQQKSHTKYANEKLFAAQEINEKQPKKSTKNTKHKSVHISDMDVSEMEPDERDIKAYESMDISTISASTIEALAMTTITTTTTTTATSQASIAPVTRIPENILSSNEPIVRADVTNELIENGVVLNDRVTSISVIEHDDNIRNRIHINNDTTKPVILASIGTQIVSDENEDGVNDKGYYEKTIINKNGVFIENIRKISNIDQRILGTIDDSDINDGITATDNSNNNNNNGNTISVQSKSKANIDANENFLSFDRDTNIKSTNDNMNISSTGTTSIYDTNAEINRKSIELMNNVPVAQHYVITSSGKIEKTDTMASDDILAQFQGGLNNNNNNNYNTNRNYTRNTNYNANNAFSDNKNNNLSSNWPSQQQSTNGNTVSSLSSTTTTTNFAGKNRFDVLPGGIFLTTLNSPMPASVTTSTLSDQSNTNCIVMGM